MAFMAKQMELYIVAGESLYLCGDAISWAYNGFGEAGIGLLP
jgi:hypothetical protein